MSAGTEKLSAVDTRIKAKRPGRRGANVAFLLLIIGVPAPPRSELKRSSTWTFLDSNHTSISNLKGMD